MKKTLLSRLVAAATLAFAAICANTATADDGVTKSRLGSLRRDDMVVVDVKGSVNTNAVRELMAEYDRSVIKPREDGISVDLSGRSVVSVNGKTGSVSLVVADIPGAASTDDVASAISGIDMSGYLKAADVPEWAKEVAKPTYSANEITGLDTALAGKQGTITAEGVIVGTGSGGVRAALKEDITALGIPAQDTTYSDAVASSNGVGGASGLMSAADKEKVDGLPVFGTSATLDVGTEAGTVAAGDHTHSQYLGVNDVHEWAKEATKPTYSAGEITGLGGAATLDVGTGAGTVAAGDHTHSQYLGVNDVPNWAKQETPPSDGDPVFIAWKASTKIETKVSNLESIAGGLTTKTTGLSDSVEDLSLSLVDLYDLALLVDDPVDYLKESPYFTRDNDQLVKTIVDVTYSKADSDDMSVTQVAGSTDKVKIQLQPGKSAIVLTAHQDISGKQGTITTTGVLVGDGEGGVRAASKADITALDIPAQDTTYSDAVASSNGVGGASGLMSAVDKEKLDCIPALGGAATMDVGTTDGTVAAGNHTHSQYLGVNDVHEWAKAENPPVESDPTVPSWAKAENPPAEQDPTVPGWAKQSSPPAESDPTVPSWAKQSSPPAESDPTVPSWAKAENPPAESDPVFSQWLSGFDWTQFITAESDPTVPSWAKSENPPVEQDPTVPVWAKQPSPPAESDPTVPSWAKQPSPPAESDPVFSQWLSGFDWAQFITAEQDPTVPSWAKAENPPVESDPTVPSWAKAENPPAESDPTVPSWAKEENPPAEQDPTVAESLSRFAATGTVYRADSYGTSTRWTDADGNVFEASLSDSWGAVNVGLPDGVDPGWVLPYWVAETDDTYFQEVGWYVNKNDWTSVLVSQDSDATEIAVDWTFYNDTEPVDVHTVFSRGMVTNSVGRIAMLSDVSGVSVVPPSKDAASGSAADARLTGAALYDGYTGWSVSEPGYSIVPYEGDEWAPCAPDGSLVALGVGDSDSTNLSWTTITPGAPPVITATRHRITPTKVSQLENDSGFTALSEAQLASISSSIPADLDEVEYVEFTGSQYVDLGFKANQGTIKIDFVITPKYLYPWPSGVNQTYHALLGSRYSTVGSTPSGRICNAFLSRGGTLRPDMVCGMAYPSEIPLPFDVTSRVILERGTAIVDGSYTNTTVTTTTGPQADQGVSFFLGYMHEEVPSSTVFAKYCGYWGPTRIYRSGVLFMDLVPVRKMVDGVYAGFFYDRVSGTLFGGTPAALLAGPVKKRSVPTLSGKTYDFSKNVDIVRALADVVEALGGSISNKPPEIVTQQGGN